MKSKLIWAALQGILCNALCELRALQNIVRGLGRRTAITANIGEGRHDRGIVTRTLDATATRYLVAKYGTSATNVGLAGASDVPFGVILDEGASGDAVQVALFSAGGTQLIQANGSIAAGASVSVTTGGKLITLPTTTGTYYQVGRALNAASNSGDLVEVDLYFCKIVI
jgi:hypothetical protein